MFKKSRFWAISLAFLLVLGSVFPALAPNIVKAETSDNDITEYIENEDVEKLKPYFYNNSLVYKTNDDRWLVVKDVNQVPSNAEEFTYLGINNCDGQCMLTLESKDIFTSETKVLDFTEWTLDGKKDKPNTEVLQHDLQYDVNFSTKWKGTDSGKEEGDLEGYDKGKEKVKPDAPHIGGMIPYEVIFKTNAISNDNVDSNILSNINKDYKLVLKDVTLEFTEGLTYDDNLMNEKENIYGYQESLTKECKTESKTRECNVYKHNVNKDLTAENNEFTMYFTAHMNGNASIDKIENAGIHSINAGPQKSHIVMDTNVKGENEVRLVMLQFAQKDIKNIDFYKQCADDITPPEPEQPSEPSKPETPEETQKCEPTILYSGITFLNQNNKNSKLNTVAELESYAKDNNADIIKNVDGFEISVIDKTTGKVLYKGNHQSDPFKSGNKYNLKEYPIENVEFKLTQVPDGYDLEDYRIVYGIESKSKCEAKEDKITRYLEHGTEEKLAEDVVSSEFAEFKIIEGYAIPSDISKSYKEEGNVRTYYYKKITIPQAGDDSEQRLPDEPEISEVTEPAKPETSVEDNNECCEELTVKMYIVVASIKEATPATPIEDIAKTTKKTKETILAKVIYEADDSLEFEETAIDKEPIDGEKEITTVSQSGKDDIVIEEVLKKPEDGKTRIGNKKVEVETKDDITITTTTIYEVDQTTGELINPQVTVEKTAKPGIIEDIATKTTVEEVEIPFEIERVENENILVGQDEVSQEGKPGKKKVTTIIVGENGEPKVTEETIEEPVNEVVQVGIKEVKQEVRQEEIPAPEKHQDSDELYEGETKVLQEGKPGKKETTFEVTYIKGEAKDSKIIKEEIVEEPEAKIILVGTKKIDFSELIELVQEEPQISTSIEYKRSPEDVQKEYDTAIQNGKDILNNKGNTSQEEVDKAVDDIKKAKGEIKKSQPKVTEEEITIKEEIDFDIVKRDDPELDKGKTEVAQKGEKGTKKLIYKVTYEDGEEILRELVSEEVTKEAKDEIILVGTKDTPAKPSEEQSVKPTQAQPKVTAKAEQNLKPFGETGAGAFGLISGLGLISAALSGAVVKHNNCKAKKNKED